MITANTLGYLYILCLDRPIGNPDNTRGLAKHYLGFAIDVQARVATHAAGRGQALTAAAVEQGIGWSVFYRSGTPGLERWLKAHYKKTPRLCPRCCGAHGRRSVYGFQPLEQLALPLITEIEDFPEPPVVRADFFEIAHLRGWNAQRALLIPAPDLARLDDLL